MWVASVIGFARVNNSPDPYKSKYWMHKSVDSLFVPEIPTEADSPSWTRRLISDQKIRGSNSSRLSVLCLIIEFTAHNMEPCGTGWIKFLGRVTAFLG